MLTRTLTLLLLFPSLALSAPHPVSETGLPLPRYASLKSDEINLRVGPGKRYPIRYLYQREALPVKIINEYGHWRHIEDFEGVQGWVHKSMLSGRHTGIIIADEARLTDQPTPSSEAKAKLFKGVIVSIEECRQSWCEVATTQQEGWLPRAVLWGIP